MKSRFRTILPCVAVLSLAITAPSMASANDSALVIFGAAIRISQAQAMKAGADYYAAIGMGQQAQQYERLANDFSSGSLGGEGGVKTFVQANLALSSDISELQAAGALPTAQERALAGKAEEEFAVAKTAMVAAVASGIYAAVDSEGSVLQKIILTATLASIALRVNQSLDTVSQVSRAYRNFELGAANGFQDVSKELSPQFTDL